MTGNGDIYRAFCEFVRNKKVTLMGLGVLGRGVGDALFLSECGAKLTVTDLKSEEQLQDSVQALSDENDIALVLGRHRKEDFSDTDLVLQAPATSLDSPYIQAAKDADVRVSMSTALCAKFASEHGVRIVGVTGTRGKSTVTQMIYDVLKQQGTHNVHLGGNVRGVSTLALLREMREGDVLVLELDSWQLQGFGYEHLSPDIAVFTNFMEDHLDYYPDMKKYFADKANIFAYQNYEQGDTLVVGDEVETVVRDAKPSVEPIVAVPIPQRWELQVPGIHNRENAALAREALAALGVSEVAIQEGLEEFTGVAGRLERVATISGVDVYNDNNATTPFAAVAALKSFPKGRIVLIAGGTDKGVDLQELMETITSHTKKLLCIDKNATGTQKLIKEFTDAPVYDSLDEALGSALQEAHEGDVVLFSPAFASFGIFKNEYDRSDKFIAAVEKI